MDELINLLLLATVKRIPEPVWQWFVRQKGVVRILLSVLFFTAVFILAAGLFYALARLIRASAS